MERLTNKKEADARRRAYEKRLEQGYPRNIPEERFLRLAAYEDTGLEPEEITVSPRPCVFYCNRRCTLDNDWCAEGPGCQNEIGKEEAAHLLEQVKARDEGRVVALPEVSERDRQSLADFLHDCFAEWIHDPSVGLYGMTEGEAALANAIMAALTRAEAEAALSGGGQK